MWLQRAYIPVKETATAVSAGADPPAIQAILKHYAPFNEFLTQKNNTQV